MGYRCQVRCLVSPVLRPLRLLKKTTIISTVCVFASLVVSFSVAIFTFLKNRKEKEANKTVKEDIDKPRADITALQNAQSQPEQRGNLDVGELTSPTSPGW